MNCLKRGVPPALPEPFPYSEVIAQEIHETQYLEPEVVDGQFLELLALLRGLRGDLLESLHVPASLSRCESHSVALARCIRRCTRRWQEVKPRRNTTRRRLKAKPQK